MENKKILHVGLDVGSTTVKIVIMDNNLNTIYTNYRRHFSDTKNTVCDVLEELANDYSDYDFTIALTGSGAMSASTFLDLPFIQEVVSCKRAVEKSRRTEHSDKNRLPPLASAVSGGKSVNRKY